jgi:hypothetical protein
MNSGASVTLPWDNAVFVVLTLIIVLGTMGLGVAAFRLDRKAELRGLKWHWMGGSAFYLWPESGDGTRGGRSILVAVLSLIAVIALLLALGAYGAIALQ